MRNFSLYKFIISAIILIVTIYFCFYLKLFYLEELKIFILAFLCGWSIREVWSNDYNKNI